MFEIIKTATVNFELVFTHADLLTHSGSDCQTTAPMSTDCRLQMQSNEVMCLICDYSR